MIDHIEKNVEVLRGLLKDGKISGEVSAYIRPLLEGDLWLDFGYQIFEQFCKHELRCSVDDLLRVCRNDRQVVSMITESLKVNHQGFRTDTRENAKTPFRYRPQGNTKERALRRLKRDRPDLYRRVLNGELSANAAMIEAGFRRKQVSVFLTAESVAELIINNFDRKEFEKLCRIVETEWNEKQSE